MVFKNNILKCSTQHLHTGHMHWNTCPGICDICCKDVCMFWICLHVFDILLHPLMYLTTKTYQTVTSNSFQLFDLVPFPEHICSRLKTLFYLFYLFWCSDVQCLFCLNKACSSSGSMQAIYVWYKTRPPNAILQNPSLAAVALPGLAVWELTCLGSRWFQACELGLCIKILQVNHQLKWTASL